MKCISFNVNSVRMRMHQLHSMIDHHQPDFIGLQETKVQDKDFPVAEIESMGYHVEYYGGKTHYGVALMSKLPPVAVQKGFPGDEQDAQRRMVMGTYEIDGRRLTVLNGYFPQGESRDHPIKFPAKERFYQDLMNYLETHLSPDDAVVVMGDFNVAPVDLDIGIGPDNAKRWLRSGKASFLPEEREWIRQLEAWGLVDTFRLKYPEKDQDFSWFDYRSRGFEREPRRGLRIDHIMATDRLAERLIDCGIDYDIRGMEKPSDHCPVWSEFRL